MYRSRCSSQFQPSPVRKILRTTLNLMYKSNRLPKIAWHRRWLRTYTQRREALPLASDLYIPLDKSKHEIRVLTLQAGHPGSSLSCKLTNVPLGDYSRYPEGVYRWSDGQTLSPGWQAHPAEQEQVQWVPTYEALSYAWGDPDSTCPVNVNGVEMRITTNLFAALSALRQHETDKALWVDALCINQRNIQERSDQVQRMRTIYQRAQQTILWLGDADQSSDWAMQLLEKLNGTQAQINSFPRPPDMLTWVGTKF